MPEFHPVANTAPLPGLVLRVGVADDRFLRITHVFDDCVYCMWVSEPENAYYARRPKRMPVRELQQLAIEPTSSWGRLELPTVLSESPQPGSKKAEAHGGAWSLIEPLISQFQTEANLSRSSFTALIRHHADATQTRFITLNRMVLRYYYFGGTRLALIPLTTGLAPGHAGYAGVATNDADHESRPPRRRGRQAILAKELGRNDFIVSAEDVADMVECLKSCLRKGPTFLTHAHEEYLAGLFRKRHGAIYADYIARRRVEPVTAKQYRYYVDGNEQLSEELSRNLRTREGNGGYLGSLRAAGPGEVYEIDSTGGRLYLISATDPPVQVGKPTVYLIIDRWSRFVVSVYISLRSPSYEEVRHALLVAFTSREARFKALGIDIDDERWPVGRVPAELCPDRGSDFMSKSMEQAVVQDLRISLTPLPPFCPDGKAIVERMIREIKRRMAASGMKGVYADRPLDPKSKRVARKAAAVAVRSLTEAYRMLIEIVVDHNNRPHTALRRRKILSQAGVEPTPKDAYLCGLQNITGLRTAPFIEDDYRRLLLSVDTASIANKTLRYKTRAYLPANEAAYDLAARSTSRAKQVSIRVDRTGPYEIFIPTARGTWAQFRISPGGANELVGLSLDEEEALSSTTALLTARAEHGARVDRLAAKSASSKRSTKRMEPAIKLDKREQIDARNRETADLKRQLTGQVLPRASDLSDEPSTPSDDVNDSYEQQRLRNLERIREHRDKQRSV